MPNKQTNKDPNLIKPLDSTTNLQGKQNKNRGQSHVLNQSTL